MIKEHDITGLVGNHVAPYLYGAQFEPGKTLIPYSGPYWDSREVVSAINAFLNGQWISAGENVQKFEKAFGRKFHNKYCLMVNSGSSANLVMLTALKKYYGWEDNDEIIVSPVGFPTTVSVIYQNRLKPIFADIEWDTLNFDLGEVEKKITGKTKAVILSPVLGNPPDMQRLIEICLRSDVKLILDNCDSLGSMWEGSYLSEYAIASSNSFYASHHISSLDYKEKVFVVNKKTKLPRLVQIGDFVEYYNKQDWQCFAFDENGKIHLKDITGVVKHICDEDLYKLTVQTGRETTVTGTHSVFTIKNGKIKDIEVNNLKIGDLILSPNKLPNLQVIKEISIIKYKKGNWKAYLAKLNLDVEFGNFLGWFIAEGSFSKSKRGNHNLTFNMGSTEIVYAKRLQTYLKTLSITSHIYVIDTKLILVFSNKSLFNFLSREVGITAKNKKVPDFMFAAPTSCKEAFIEAYFQGDGCTHITYGQHKGFSFDSVTVSKELAIGVFYLLLQLGTAARFSLKQGASIKVFEKYISQCLPAYSVCYSSKSIFNAESFRTGGIHKNEKRKFEDLSLVKITKIEKVKPTKPYVYDLSVKGYENFIGGIGFALHNTGEGGMVCTDNEELYKLMQSITYWGRACYCVGAGNMRKGGSCGKRFDNWLKNYDGIVDHKYVFSNMGYNLKPLDLQGAIGCIQLEKFDEIDRRRKRSKYVIEPIVTQIEGVISVEEFEKADVCWFGVPFICETKELKQSLVAHLEQNKIQTRNYFAGNILMHSGFSFLDDYRDYPQANKVLEKVFFLGCAPHYTDTVFSYINDVVKQWITENR